MMKLFTAGPSPFGRKIKMALDVVGLTDNVELERLIRLHLIQKTAD